MGENDEPTRLDLKIARDKLLENIEPIWDLLVARVEATCGKLRAAYGLSLASQVNDQNSVIRVIDSDPARTAREDRMVDRTLELRIDREARKVVARITARYGRAATQGSMGDPRSYPIVPNAAATALEFGGRQQRFSAVELAEHEIAERLLKMEL